MDVVRTATRPPPRFDMEAFEVTAAHRPATPPKNQQEIRTQ
jgi:hypothetical protein